MVKVKRLIGLVVILTLVVTGVAYAAEERGTAADAKAILAKAAAYVKEVGKANAISEFNKPNGKFVNKDIYIFASDLKGICLAHGKVPALIGKDCLALKDADGKLFIKEAMEGANKKGSGQVEYRWSNPISKKVERKITLYTKVNDLILFCGYYK
ncbi:MAG: cache domain-containing protein [Syntrophales bacterium]|nr:cache domain-containing protein [Syntrophales bacterium]